MKLLANNVSVQGNQIWFSFADYVACISQDVDPKKLEEADSIYDDDSDCWSIQFMKGNYNKAKKSHKIYCNDLEAAIKLLEHYSDQIMFDELIRQLNNHEGW